MARRIHIGTAGWSIPRASAHRFGIEGSHLQRFAAVFPSVEINSSFHRPHAATTYARWAEATPSDFRFAVKLPRSITHDRQLRRAREPLGQFLSESGGLGSRRGPLLVQLPPSLAFDGRVAARFFGLVRSLYDGSLVCEPRHPSWFGAAAETLLRRHHVGRVAADPARTIGADVPAGWPGIAYFRLHGSPRIYWSSYDRAYLARLAATIARVAVSAEVWCIFDNTASGAAAENAGDLQTLLAIRPGVPLAPTDAGA